MSHGVQYQIHLQRLLSLLSARCTLSSGRQQKQYDILFPYSTHEDHHGSKWDGMRRYVMSKGREGRTDGSEGQGRSERGGKGKAKRGKNHTGTFSTTSSPRDDG